MAYAPRGFLPSEIGDVEVVAHEGRLHLYHLTLPNHDLVGHAVSRDGIVWEPRAPVLRAGDPGEVDDDQIWTMGIATAGGRHHMLYTALDRAGGGRAQRTALAVSDDLVRWNKRGAVAEADPERYETEGGPWVSWRDPKPVEHGDEWLAPICARDLRSPWLRRGAVGLLRSTDLETWTVEAPILSPRRFFDVECPQLLERDGRWYLIASVIDDRSIRWWVADDPRGPFRTPADNVLVPRGGYAGRVVRWQGEDLLFVVHEREEPGRLHKVLGSPQRLGYDGEGRPRCHPHGSAWAKLFEPEAELDPASLEPLTGTPGTDGLSVSAGTELWALPGEHGQLRLALAWRTDAAACGFFFGLDEDLAGTLVELEGGAARLVEVGRATLDGRPWFRRHPVQEARLVHPISAPFELRVSDHEVELAHGGETLLFAAHPPRRGRVGLWAEDGRLEPERIRLSARR